MVTASYKVLMEPFNVEAKKLSFFKLLKMVHACDIFFVCVFWPKVHNNQAKHDKELAFLVRTWENNPCGGIESDAYQNKKLIYFFTLQSGESICITESEKKPSKCKEPSGSWHSCNQ